MQAVSRQRRCAGQCQQEREEAQQCRKEEEVAQSARRRKAGSQRGEGRSLERQQDGWHKREQIEKKAAALRRCSSRGSCRHTANKPHVPNHDTGFSLTTL